MKKGNKKIWSTSLSMALSAAMVLSGVSFSGAGIVAHAQEGMTELTAEEISELTSDASFSRTSVHDPSIVYDNEGTYYVFGSHMGVSKSTDLENWTSIYTDNPSSGIFVENYNSEFKANTNAGQEVTVLDNEGNETLATFANYDLAAWIAGNTVNGNMWAPDVIYNEAMGKWCMYLSLNGANWNSGIVLLTADDIEGPYDYVGPVVFSGFSTSNSSKNFHDTDIELVIGQQDELPVKYQKIADRSWGDYWPHAIDPAVFYDEEGDLWMTYGSWSGGIYVLELDENTGLRDYTVKYEDNYDSLGKSVTSDPYFGTKIAGGYYVSGEGSYIEHIGEYYYLFMSYGFYSPEGGYNMRVFRSENPDGPYVDENGVSAIFNRYIQNYHATDASNNRGVKLMGGYKWETMGKAELSQGHNSAIAANDGKIYLVYHTKFNDGTAGHEIRVHQMFLNEEGWLVTAPYEYAGETLSDTGYDKEALAGNYDLIIHKFQMKYGDLEYVSPLDITLNADGTVSGAKEGTWSVTEGTPYCQITIDGQVFKGVFTEQKLGGTNVPVMAFTAVNSDGLTIWGSGEMTDKAAIAITAANNAYNAPSTVYGSFSLPSEGDHGTTITWKSSNTDVIADDGTVTGVEESTDVTLTARISKGSYFFDKAYTVTVKKLEQNETDSLVLAEFFTGETVDLSSALSNKFSVSNPFYKGTANGLNLSGGVTISFDTTSTGNVNVLGTILAFRDDKKDTGRMYFTPGSYLGYNANGSWYDANLNSYSLVKDYIGDSAHVDINLTPTGFTVNVNGEVAYTEAILATENGDGTIDGEYTKVLKWLYNDADTLYFGSGSWWNDVANSTISNVVCTVGPIDPNVDLSEEEKPQEEVEADVISFTKDRAELTSNDYIEILDNPFYGKNLEKVTLKYTINIDPRAAKNGWDGIFSFYNSATGGRVSVQTNPYLCYNSDGWIDMNQPGDTADNRVLQMATGKDYDVEITITSEGVTMKVDGDELNPSYNGSTSSYEKILTAISGADQLTFGVGLAQTSYWYTELCTLTNIEFTSSAAGASEEPTEPEEPTDPEEPEEPTEYDEVFYSLDELSLQTNDALTVVDNPFSGKTIDKLYISYTIKMNEASVKNGWDCLFGFYDTETTGRVTVQSAPYLCYNDMDGNWIDFNNPNLAGAVDFAPSFAPGTEHKVTITVTKDATVFTVDGEEIAVPQDGSASASNKKLLKLVTDCDELTLGVGLAQKGFWYTEICDISDLVLSTGKTSAEAEEPVEPEDPTEPEDPEEPENPDEPEVQTGSLVSKWGSLYYVLEDGSVLKGLKTIDGNTYYFKEKNGAAVKGDFYDIEGDRYYFDSDCHMVTGFMTKWASTYFFAEDGKLVTGSIFEADGNKYYANEKGVVTKSKFVEFEDGTRYFDSEGCMVRGTTMTRWFKSYTFDDDGILVEE